MASETGIGCGPTDCPKWAKSGVRVRVKSTPILREYGIRCRIRDGASKADDRVWPGDVGTVEVEQGNEWWRYVLAFERGRTVVPHYSEGINSWTEFVRIPVPRAKPSTGHVCVFCGSTKPYRSGDDVHEGYDGYPVCPDCGGV